MDLRLEGVRILANFSPVLRQTLHAEAIVEQKATPQMPRGHHASIRCPEKSFFQTTTFCSNCRMDSTSRSRN